MESVLFSAFVYLAAGVIAAPIANRLGLGSVLGYLAAGLIIGPFTGLVGSESQTVQHFAEFGVVVMLFLIGLELEPRRLWELRDKLFGLGAAQVGLTTLLIAATLMAFGVSFNVALATGMILSLSSTAIVLQTMQEKSWMNTEGGRSAFSTLLFQDIAVIPMLALMPLLASPELAAAAADAIGGQGADAGAHAEAGHGDADHGEGGHGSGSSFMDDLPGWAQPFVILGAVALVIAAGRFLGRPAFRFIALSNIREAFTAAALLLVVGISLLMTLVGLSPALGAFLAGVVLADSEFRHELEADLDPVKGLLLGLFFITVGAGVDLALLSREFVAIFGATLGLFAVKFGVMMGLAVAFRLGPGDRWIYALGLAQAGEFGFVLLTFALGAYVLPPEFAAAANLVVALSMLMTPGVFIILERVILARLSKPQDDREADAIDESSAVVIAGYGRFGQITQRILNAINKPAVVLDHAADHIESLRKFGARAYYGDATRPDLLKAAGLADAKVLLVAIDDNERAVELVRHVKKFYPQVYVVARAFDRLHVYRLREAGADKIVRELFGSALEAAESVLERLGMHPYRAHRMAQAFRAHDEETVHELYEVFQQEQNIYENRAYIARVKERNALLAATIESDRDIADELTESEFNPAPERQDEDGSER